MSEKTKTIGDVAQLLSAHLCRNDLLFTGNASEWIHAIPDEKQLELLSLAAKVVGLLSTQSASDVEEATNVALNANIALLCLLADSLPLVEWAANAPELQEQRDKAEYAKFADQFMAEPEDADLLLHAMSLLSTFALAIAQASKAAAMLRIIGGKMSFTGFEPFSDPEQRRPLNPTERHEAIATNYAALLPIVLPYIRLIAEIPQAERAESLTAAFPPFTIRQSEVE